MSENGAVVVSRVGDRMTTPPIVVEEDAALETIARLLERHSISALPVVASGRLAGIVSTTDVVKTMASTANDATRARSLMSAPVVIARRNEPIEEAATKLVARGVHRLVVVDEDRPVGILGARDILVALRHRRPTVTVGALMSSPVNTIDVGDSIDTAVGALASANVHGLVVVDADWPVGAFTHREALAARALPPELRRRPVEEVMSYETICLDAATPAYRAVAHAIAMDVRRLLVVHERRLVGILSCVDLVRALIAD